MAVRTNKAEWLAQRLADEQARGLYGNKRFDWSTNQWVKPDGTPAKRPKPPNPFGKEGSLSKQIDKQLAGFEKDRQKAANQAVANAAPKHARLIADVDSTCFEDVTWKDDVLTCTFWRGGQLVYQYFDVSRDDFVDMVSGSMGSWFNENLR
jgi:hypothetical protein